MFDRIDPGPHRALGRFRAVRVRRRLPPQRVGFVHQRVEFLLAQLRNIHIVGGREHAAAGAGLDHIGAVFDVEADRVASLIR